MSDFAAQAGRARAPRAGVAPASSTWCSWRPRPRMRSLRTRRRWSRVARRLAGRGVRRRLGVHRLARRPRDGVRPDRVRPRGTTRSSSSPIPVAVPRLLRSRDGAAVRRRCRSRRRVGVDADGGRRPGAAALGPRRRRPDPARTREADLDAGPRNVQGRRRPPLGGHARGARCVRRELADVDLFVYHQANSRIIQAVGKRLGLPEDRVVDYVDRFANSSTATLPIALSVAEREGRLRGGDTVLLASFGGGFTWGATGSSGARGLAERAASGNERRSDPELGRFSSTRRNQIAKVPATRPPQSSRSTAGAGPKRAQPVAVDPHVVTIEVVVRLRRSDGTPRGGTGSRGSRCGRSRP